MDKNDSNKPLEGEIVEEKEIGTALLPPEMTKQAGKSGNIFIGTLNLATAPARAFTRPLHRHYHSRYHGKYKHAKKLFIFDLALVGVAVVLLAASLYFFFVKPSTNFLNISLNSNGKIIIGQNQDFVFQLANATNRPLSNLILNFEFPSQLEIKEFPPNFNPQTAALFFDFLKEKQTAELKFKSRLWGAVGANHKIAIRARFNEGENNAPAEQLFFLNLAPAETALKVEWDTPEQIMVGQNLNLVVRYQNDSTEALEKAVLAPVLPDDFEIISSAPDLKDNRWVLENIVPSSRGQINLLGYIRSLPRFGNVSLALQSFLEHNNEQLLQSSFLQYIKVKENDLILESRLENDKKFLKAGEETALKVAYRNQGDKTVKDAVFQLSLPAFLVKDGQFNLKIDKTTVPALAEIAPGKNNAVYFTFQLRDGFGAGAEQNLTLAPRPFAVFHFSDNPTETIRAFAPPLTVRISSILKLHSQARYFTDEGDQLGRGPLPPRVGQTTKYWINWFITSVPNALKNIIVSGRLPANVQWTDKTNVAEGEPVKFDPITRAVSWRSDKISATPGGQCPCQGVGFEVAITPTAENIGQEMNLLEQQQIQGIDSFTSEELTASVANLTTDLIFDSRAKGRGEVQP